MVQFCAKVIAPGMQASAKLRGSKKSSSRPLCLAPLAQGATLSIHTIFSILKILTILDTLRILSLSQLMGLGHTGAGEEGDSYFDHYYCPPLLPGGEDAAKVVEGKAPELELGSALHLQMGADHVTDQRLREKPVSENLARVSMNSSDFNFPLNLDF